MCECVVCVCVRVYGGGMRDIWCGFTILQFTGQNAALRCDTKIANCRDAACTTLLDFYRPRSYLYALL